MKSMELNQLILIVTIFNMVSAQQKYKYVREEMSNRDKKIIMSLTHELVVDAKYKIHQLDGVKDRLSIHSGAQVGMIMGQIREKYRSMLEVYRQTSNKLTGKSKLIMPSVETRRPLHYFLRMEYISALEVDIERLVHVLETMPPYLLEMRPFRQDRREEQSKRPPLRMDQNQKFESLFALQEQKIKSEHRQKYLMERLGMSSNQTTTSKRFLKHWPVDGTWSLDKYNY